MSRHVLKLPDLGEGTVAAEIVAWRVKPGDVVAEDDILVEVMTDKAAVEVPSPVSGKVISTNGNPGESVPVGSELIVFETLESGGSQAADGSAATAAGGSASSAAAAVRGAVPGGGASPARGSVPAGGASPDGRAVPGGGAVPARGSVPANGAQSGRQSGNGVQRGSGVQPRDRLGEDGHPVSARTGRVATSPAIRRRAHEAGIDLSQIHGSGPNGRIVREDLDAHVARRPDRDRHHATPAAPTASVPAPLADATEEIKVIGVRRLIAQKMSEAKRNIPHFAYVEEIDVTELESLRRHLNAGAPAPLSYLPFLAAALVGVLEEFPQCNATYDADRGVIVRHRAVHLGVAAQTPDGLKVPVVRDAQNRSLWELAAEMRRVTEAARSGTAKREELVGSTITVSSLGKLGGIASTPIINSPEVAIVGVNRAVERPVVIDGAIVVRRMMNLSSSFDHRFVDGYDAAAMIQALKERIEHPATIFIDR
jgi:2-oxoisovalerate dehydrogenase E2 component (dihydrolipoyl transacylase)